MGCGYAPTQGVGRTKMIPTLTVSQARAMKVGGLMGLLILLVLALDVFVNYPVPVGYANNQLPVLPQAAEFSGEKPDRDLVAKLQDLTSRLGSSVKASSQTEKGTASWLSNEQQAKQRGIVDKLYVGDNAYELKGTAYQTSWVALLRQTNKQGVEDTPDIIQFNQGDKIGSYLFTSISSRFVLLSDGDREVKLVLFHQPN